MVHRRNRLINSTISVCFKNMVLAFHFWHYYPKGLAHPRNEPYLLEYYVIEYTNFLARGSELVMLEPRQHLISSQQRLLPLYTISFTAGYTVSP